MNELLEEALSLVSQEATRLRPAFRVVGVDIRVGVYMDRDVSITVTREWATVEKVFPATAIFCMEQGRIVDEILDSVVKTDPEAFYSYKPKMACG